MAQRIECLNAVNNVWSVLDVAGVVYEKHIIMKGTEAINKRANFIEHHHRYTTHTTNSCRFTIRWQKQKSREMAVKQENNDACKGIACDAVCGVACNVIKSA